MLLFRTLALHIPFCDGSGVRAGKLSTVKDALCWVANDHCILSVHSIFLPMLKTNIYPLQSENKAEQLVTVLGWSIVDITKCPQAWLPWIGTSSSNTTPEFWVRDYWTGQKKFSYFKAQRAQASCCSAILSMKLSCPWWLMMANTLTQVSGTPVLLHLAFAHSGYFEQISNIQFRQ